MRRPETRGLIFTVAWLVAFLGSVTGAPPAYAVPTLSVEPIAWNVVGLDSNDVATGPNTYPVGVRVCNTSAETATAVVARFAWTTSGAALSIDGPADSQLETLAPSTCRDAYWNVVVDRSVTAYGTARSYVVTVSSAEGATATTVSPREIYVESLISQNRNSVNAISGPTSVLVGDVITFTVDANTATNGYEQLEAFLTLPSSVFQLLSTSVTYGAPAGATNDMVYADACGWDNDPASATYLSCVGPEQYAGGKVGGALVATFTVRVIGTGTVPMTAAIYDKSGSSYHYNSDFGVAPNLIVVTASQPAPTTTTTSTTSTTTTTTVPPPSPATTTTPPASAAGLPATGLATGRLTVLGLVLSTIGGALVVCVPVGDRRRRRRVPAGN